MEIFKNSTRKIDNEEKMSGEALFVDDISVKDALFVRAIRSSIPCGKIVSISIPSLPSGYFYIDEKDIVKENVVSIIYSDWPVFAKGSVSYYGETIGLLIGPNKETLESLFHAVKIEYEPHEPNYSFTNSVVHKEFKKGSIEEVKKDYDFKLEETFETGYQEHVYLEPQGMIMYYEEDQIVVKASMQCPFYIKKAIVRTLGCLEDKVRVIQPAVGGAFGGKEHYPSLLGAQLATALYKIKKPLKFIFDRDEDILFTTKRHPSKTTYVGYIKNGNLVGVEAHVRLNGGAYIGCSSVVLSRSLIAVTNCYTIPNLYIQGDVYLTNTMPSAAFRGFGSPQTIFAFEMFIKHIATKAGYEQVEFRRRHLAKTGDTTAVNGKFYDPIILDKLTQKAFEISKFEEKYNEYSKPGINKGIGVSFFFHGCGFTGSGESTIIKAQVKLKKDKNNIVHLFTSQVDFGQGNRTTLKKIVSDTLNCKEEQVTHEAPDTNHTLNTGPTAASRTIIIVGYLCEKAAKKLKEIWIDGEEQEVIEPYVGPSYISWDEDKMQGDAYPGYAWGVNVIEVSYDPITYQIKVDGVWSTYDVGHAIDERIVIGQCDGGIAQGIGYGYLENLNVKDGKFLQKTLSDYIIPTSMDLPAMETELIDNPFIYGAQGAKGCGELTLVGGAPSLCQAIEMAINRNIYKIPATPEYIMELIDNEDL